MTTNNPTIVFKFLDVDSIRIIGSLLDSLDPKELQEIQERYSILSSLKDQKIEHCPINELLYEDIEKEDERGWIRQYYELLIKRHGIDKVNFLIPRRRDIVTKKIINIIDFVLDQVYKTEQVHIEIDGNWQRSMIPHLIADLLREHYEVTDVTFFTSMKSFTIKKKGNQS